jgi:hypothetical protein
MVESKPPQQRIKKGNLLDQDTLLIESRVIGKFMVDVSHDPVFRPLQRDKLPTLGLFPVCRPTARNSG